MRTWAAFFVSLICIAALLSGCYRVKPYQREIHSRKTMQKTDKVEQKLDGHVSEYREGAVGGDGAGGGGCGCN